LPLPFLIGFLIFTVVWLTISVVYVMHRNARMPDELKVLTPDHIRYVFESKGKGDKKKKGVKRLTFISAHDNELPVPSRQDSEFPGYVVSDGLINDMWTRRVSTMEVTPTGEKFQLRYVIDGVVSNAGEREKMEGENLIGYLKEVGGLDSNEKRRPQEGKFSTLREQDKAQWKLKTAGSTRGEHMILERVEKAQSLKLEDIGLNKDQAEKLKEVVSEPAGVVLVTGPKGSGVTTTLYTLTRRHDPFMQHIHTLEKKLLLEMDNITQHVVDVSADAKGTARQLQSVLRGDPDIVLVGFCDDQKMAQYGTQSALEGKKLYYGLTEPSTFHALQLWLKIVNDNEASANSLLAIINQKLVRKLCSECREAYVPDPGLLKKLNLPADKIKQFYRAGEIEYDKRGRPLLCSNCQGTGYVGRTAVFELLIITDPVRQLIKDKAPINAIKTQSRKEKMLYLQEIAIRKVIEGSTSIQEVLRVTSETPAKKSQKSKK
ncbi:MAG: Flp pilus assembly complex ATPase component, partial [Planctomycetes bacterium]|nr:Flp pilus assembly complex ATPase component [Planctomycetota bacterium]